MLRSGSLVLLGVCSLLLLAGCGSSSISSSVSEIGASGGSGSGGTGNGNPIGGGGGTSGTSDSVVATFSAVSDVAGTHETVSITFTSSDGQPITGFGISGNMTSLPAGWSGPASFACASVSTGSGCVLNLTYAPTAATSGTLTLGYVFVANSGVPNTTETLSVPYVATPADNVVATTSPTGQITAVAGSGSQSVAVTFNTDDGTVATGFSLTNLNTLPAGWSTASTSFACATVSTGSGCQLQLVFAPSSASISGTLTLNYTFTDNAGSARTGSLTVPYTATTHDDVIATTAPGGQITAVAGSGSQSVAVTFDTNDGTVATGFSLTNLNTLPAGWSTASTSFACTTVSTGNGCQLQLVFAPSNASITGTLTLNYAYTDNAGTAQTGSLNVPYAATTHDNVVATASPGGQITAVGGSGTQPVTVTFTTDDTRVATGLTVTTDLTALPAGWSSASQHFACNTVSTGNTCQLQLTFAPPNASISGTLTLNYAYTDDAGAAKTGVLNVSYTATTHDHIVGTPSPTSVSVAASSYATVTVTFTTDDGRVATDLALTTNLTGLPAEWSAASSSLPCATVSTGNACTLSLTYAPTAVTAGSPMLNLNYSYDDDAGTAQTGTVGIQYAATPPPHLYVADFGNTVLVCSLDGNGLLTACQNTGSFTPGSMFPYFGATDIAFYGASYAYVADYGMNSVYLCTVMGDGTLSNCNTTGGTIQSAWHLAVQGTTLYVTSAADPGGVTACAIALNGTLSCAPGASGTGMSGIAVGTNWAYLAVEPNVVDVVDVCPVSALSVPGGLSNCTGTGTGFTETDGISLWNGYAYVGSTATAVASVTVCAVNGDGTLSGCSPSIVGYEPTDVAFDGTHAYVSDLGSNNLNVCTVASNGALTNCAATQVMSPTPFPPGNGVAIH